MRELEKLFLKNEEKRKIRNRLYGLPADTSPHEQASNGIDLIRKVAMHYTKLSRDVLRETSSQHATDYFRLVLGLTAELEDIAFQLRTNLVHGGANDDLP